jgi:hypothetical protein
LRSSKRTISASIAAAHLGLIQIGVRRSSYVPSCSHSSTFIMFLVLHTPHPPFTRRRSRFPSAFCACFVPSSPLRLLSLASSFTSSFRSPPGTLSFLAHAPSSPPLLLGLHAPPPSCHPPRPSHALHTPALPVPPYTTRPFLHPACRHTAVSRAHGWGFCGGSPFTRAPPNSSRPSLHPALHVPRFLHSLKRVHFVSHFPPRSFTCRHSSRRTSFTPLLIPACSLLSPVHSHASPRPPPLTLRLVLLFTHLVLTPFSSFTSRLVFTFVQHHRSRARRVLTLPATRSSRRRDREVCRTTGAGVCEGRGVCEMTR